ncbi:hypothetical protein KFZ56_06135 [Virgibacillus sp. NKC19-3]|nr:hypothetical protein [Virgibacillus sp. NKC19-3]MBY7142661.1 hypothetical protein [Virgibacillus sp. NKC19-3]
MVIAIMIYIASMVFSAVLNIFLLYKVEKSGVKRWGATGRLFKYKQD